MATPVIYYSKKLTASFDHSGPRTTRDQNVFSKAYLDTFTCDQANLEMAKICRFPSIRTEPLDILVSYFKCLHSILSR